MQSVQLFPPPMLRETKQVAHQVAVQALQVHAFDGTNLVNRLAHGTMHLLDEPQTDTMVMWMHDDAMLGVSHPTHMANPHAAQYSRAIADVIASVSYPQCMASIQGKARQGQIGRQAEMTMAFLGL